VTGITSILKSITISMYCVTKYTLPQAMLNETVCIHIGIFIKMSNVITCGTTKHNGMDVPDVSIHVIMWHF
jgi:hypothetical protein